MNARGIGPQGLGTSKNNGYTIGEAKGCKCKGNCKCGKSHMKQKSPLMLKDACYRKVKASYDVFPSAYASGAIAKCRKNK
jgi:hypothetical protein